MTEIKLKNGETGYEAVARYIYRYWNHYRYTDSVLVKLAICIGSVSQSSPL